MTKAELVEKMAKDAGISKVAASAALNSFMTNVSNSLQKKDDKVTLVGFGTFSKVRREARKGRNPQTGEAIQIEARNVVKFKPAKALTNALRGGVGGGGHGAGGGWPGGGHGTGGGWPPKPQK